MSPLFTDLTLGSSTHFLWLLYMKSVILDDFTSPLGKALSPFAFLNILPIQCECLQSTMWGIMIPKFLRLALCFQCPFWKFLQTCPHWLLSFGFLHSPSPWRFVLQSNVEYASQRNVELHSCQGLKKRSARVGQPLAKSLMLATVWLLGFLLPSYL